MKFFWGRVVGVGNIILLCYDFFSCVDLFLFDDHIKFYLLFFFF